MQTLLRDPAAGIMHSLIYFSFLILLAVTTTLEIDHQLPEEAKFLHGQVYQGYSAVGDAAGLALLVGVVWAIVRRYIVRPYRIRIKSKPEHAVILGTFLALGRHRLRRRGVPHRARGPARRSRSGRSSATRCPTSSTAWTTCAAGHQAWWIAHVVTFLAFLAILPVTMLRHMFTSPLNMYLRDRERPKGAMKPMPNLMETELESFGASTIEDFTWKQLLDTDACTMCGRCTCVCPAHATGKPLDPREIVLKTGEVMAATGDAAGRRRRSAWTPTSPSAPTRVFERITPEEVWACTTCKACDEICPVNIEILDKILDMRRYLSLMESNFPTELGNAYRSMENSGNPWGMSQGERADWAVEARRHRDRRRHRARSTHEYLYWVGCAGSFDDKNQKVTQAMAKLMQRAGIDFAILGPSENCTGDPARRSGNEYIFQMLAMQNIETLNGMGVKKIITQCPHCFNTLMNEYPQLGGHYEVVHHSQFLEWLVDTGQARPERGPSSTSGSCTTTPATSAATTTSTSRPARSSAARRHRGRRGRPQRHQGHVLRRRRRPHVDGGDHRQARSTTSAPQELHRHRRQPHRHRLPLLLHHDRRRGEGRRARKRTRSRWPTSPCTSSRPSRPASGPRSSASCTPRPSRTDDSTRSTTLCSVRGAADTFRDRLGTEAGAGRLSGPGPEPIGGQALIEGVMMRRGDRWGAAVRQPDGTIVTTSRALPAGLDRARRVPARARGPRPRRVGRASAPGPWCGRPGPEPGGRRRLLQGRRRPLDRRGRASWPSDCSACIPAASPRRLGSKAGCLQPGRGAHPARAAARLPLALVAVPGGAAGVRLPRRRAHDDPRLRARRAARTRRIRAFDRRHPRCGTELPADRGGRVDRRRTSSSARRAGRSWSRPGSSGCRSSRRCPTRSSGFAGRHQAIAARADARGARAPGSSRITTREPDDDQIEVAVAALQATVDAGAAAR